MNARLSPLKFLTAYNKRGGIHRAPAIVNDAVHDFMSILCGFQLFEAKFDDDLFIFCQLCAFYETDQKFAVGGCSFQESRH